MKVFFFFFASEIRYAGPLGSQGKWVLEYIGDQSPTARSTSAAG